MVIHALTAQETRPRCTVRGDGVLLLLRGVNLNPGAAPEDMVSVRLWLQAHRVVGVWLRPLRAVAALNEVVDDLKPEMDVGEGGQMRRRLSDTRRRAIMIRRYMVPQRDALSTLEIEDLPWLTHADRIRLREAAERVSRVGEELDAIRDRAQVVQDEIMDRRAEVMNRQMLLLSVVAAVFLPLGLVSGMSGMNVGGVPGTDMTWAFWVVTVLMAVIGAGHVGAVPVAGVSWLTPFVLCLAVAVSIP